MLELQPTVNTGPTARPLHPPHEVNSIIATPANSTNTNSLNLRYPIVSHRIDGSSASMSANDGQYMKSPPAGRRPSNSAVVDEKKREKKWSIGGFFRRRKKEVDSESSSDENVENVRKGGFMARRKAKKDQKRKKKPMLGTYDVVVARIENNFHYPDDQCNSILSDQSGYAPNKNVPKRNDGNYVDDNIEVLSKSSKESFVGSSSLDSVSRRSHRERAKARRAEVRGDGSSSDEGSQRSNSSSLTKFKSDDSINKSQRDSSLNRRTRAARTERYIKRISRDDEVQLNQDAEQKNIKLFRIPNRSPSASPILKSKRTNSLNSSVSSATIPSSHYPSNRILIENQRNQQYLYPIQKPPAAATIQNRQIQPTQLHFNRTVPNEYYMPNQKSLSYENHINRTSQSSPINGRCVQRNLSLNQVYPPNHPRSPPPPPPRDPQRKIFPTVYDSSRPISYAFENKQQKVNSQINQVPHQNVNRSSSIRSVNYPPTALNNSYNWNQPYINFRSNSDDHNMHTNFNPHVHARPASVSTETAPKRFITRHGNDQAKYQYFADKAPRSRKPIHISNTPGMEQPYLSDSQVVNNAYTERHPVQSATKFWRQKEQEEMFRRKKELDKIRGEKKEMPVRKTESAVKLLSKQNSTPPPFLNKITENSVKVNGWIPNRPETKLTPTTSITNSSFKKSDEKSNSLPKQNKDVPKLPESAPNRFSRQGSVSSTGSGELNENGERRRRKSSNLEDALDELEAIYKSLRLGDEDLLERAEMLDVPTPKQTTEPYFNWNIPRGAQSDSGYNYTRDSSSIESLNETDIPLRRSHLSRRSGVPDKVADDMAVRRLKQSDVKSPIQDPSMITPISYLSTSPVLSNNVFDFETTSNTNEPNIVLDDMVYRNIKHSNNSLKVVDPQPPFGIPIGPISVSSNSDYLHVIPENRYRSRFIPQKSPDVIKDDLAFRSLRKDHSKDANLPPLSPDDFVNNNNNVAKNENFSLKKKRAVRSLSANIYNLINRDIVKSPNIEQQEFEKAQSFSDINDAIQMAQKILKDREVIGGKSCRISSNSPTSTETLTGSTILCNNSLSPGPDKSNQPRLRVYIAKTDDAMSQKPPLPQNSDKPSKNQKEATPDGVQDLLTALANEAHETSEKLGRELAKMNVTQETNSTNVPTDTKKNSASAVKENVQDKGIDDTLSEIDAVSEHAKLCEKLLECVVESTELIAPKTAEAIEIENCFDDDSLELSFEEVEQFEKLDEPSQSVANIVLSRNADLPSEIQLDSVDSDRLSTEIICSKATEEPIDSDLETEPKERKESKSPFEMQKEALLQEFAELKKKLTKSDYMNNHHDQEVYKQGASLSPVNCISSSPENRDSEDVLFQIDNDMESTNSISPSCNSEDNRNKSKPSDPTHNNLSTNDGFKTRSPRKSLRRVQHRLWRSLSCSSLNSLSISGRSQFTKRTPTMSGSEILSNVSDMSDKMSDFKLDISDRERANRVIRYKEQRRQQLDKQFAHVSKEKNALTNGIGDSDGVLVRRYITRSKQPSASSVPNAVGSDRSTGGESGGAATQRVRTTRASRLRAAASSVTGTTGSPEGVVSPRLKDYQSKRTAIQTSAVTSTPTSDGKERGSVMSDTSGSRTPSSRTLERDKSAKRKSNLNRAPHLEEVNDTDVSSSWRRRRPELSTAVTTTCDSNLRTPSLQVSSMLSSSMHSSGDSRHEPTYVFLPSVNNIRPSSSEQNVLPNQPDTAPSVSSSHSVSSPSNISSKNVKRRPSELSIHMENARRAISMQGSDKDQKRHSLTKSKMETNRKKSGDESNSSVSKDFKVTNESRTKDHSSNDSEIESKSKRSDSSGSGTTKPKHIEDSKTTSISLRKNSSNDEHKSNSSDASIHKRISSGNILRSTSQETRFRKKSASPSSADELKNKSIPKNTEKTNASASILRTNEFARRMDTLAALTKDTLSRVEKLTGRTKPVSKQDIKSNSLPTRSYSLKREIINSNTSSSLRNLKRDSPEVTKLKSANDQLNGSSPTRRTSSGKSTESTKEPDELQTDENITYRKVSILKKKSTEEAPQISNQTVSGPISILKRKSLPQSSEIGSLSVTTSNAVQPVTFSPSVIDPPRSNKRPGILKKRRSLDESEVLRQRSCSPSAFECTFSDFKPILKNQRRSSLEEVRIRSPDLQPHSILKRKTGREDEAEDRSLGSPEPQGILKRKSGTSSSGSSTSPHVSIVAAVVLAAAGGAEIITDSQDTVRPILKKKSFSEEHPLSESNHLDSPKPILKKKSSTDTDEQEDRPMRPILKSSRKSSQADFVTTSPENIKSESPRRSKLLKSCTDSEYDVRPILKQTSSRENSPMPRLSFSSDSTKGANCSGVETNEFSSELNENGVMRRSSPRAGSAKTESPHRNSLQCENLSSQTDDDTSHKYFDVNVSRRKLSVAERVKKVESFLAKEKQTTVNTGAVPKRSRFRTDARYQTQPITAEEIKSSSSRPFSEIFTSTSNDAPLENSKTKESTPVKENQPVNHGYDSSFQAADCITSQSPEEYENNQFSRTVLRSPTLSIDHNYQYPKQCGKTSVPVFVVPNLNDRANQQSSDIDTLSTDTSNSQLISFDLTNNSDMNNANESLSSISLPISESGDSGVISATTSKVSSTDSAFNGSGDKDQGQDAVTELCRSSSVSAKASMFKQLEEQMKVAANEAKGSSSRFGRNRFRTKEQRNVDHRFSTQPITLDEVQEAARQKEQRDTETEKSSVSEENDEPDPSKLSLAERVRLFNTKITEETLPKSQGPPGLPPVKRRSRFKTQPVTTEEVESAQRINPLMASFAKHPDPDELGGISIHSMKEKIHEHAVKMLTSEVKGILKSKSAVYPIPKDVSSSSDSPRKQLKSVLKKDSFEHTPYSSSDETSNSQHLKSILKTESLDYSKDDTDVTLDKSEDRKSLIGSRKEPTDIISILHDVEEKARLQNLENERNAKNRLENDDSTVNGEHKKESNDTVDKTNTNKNVRIAPRCSDKISQVTKSIGSVLNAEVLRKCMTGAPNLHKIHPPSIKLSEDTVSDDSLKNDCVVSSSNDTSEGESSGGREVRRIIKNEAIARRRQAAIIKQREKSCLTPPTKAFLSKSNSYSAVGALSTSDQDNNESCRESTKSAGGASIGATTRSGASVRRSHTFGGVDDVAKAMSIAERCAALKNAGDNDWRRRVPKNNPADDELKTIQAKNLINETNHKYSKDESDQKHLDILSVGSRNTNSLQSILADRVCRLETASQEWKKRVEQTDAVKFSVAGRMEEASIQSPLVVQSQLITSKTTSETKRTPKQSRFRSKNVITKSASSTPVSPEKNMNTSFKRSVSVPGTNTDEHSDNNNLSSSPTKDNPLITIPKADNETFTSFFSSLTKSSEQTIPTDISSADFDAVAHQLNSLVVHKRELKIQRRHGTSRNPLKTLSARTDILNEYVEIKTGVAEKEARRLMAEQLAKNSSMAVEALAGLASKEDFTAVSLKKARATATTSMLPYKDLMLLHVKGRRHIQTRLVEPTISSINSGDNYILVTPTEIYNYVGLYSNIIEQSRAADIASHIQQYKDLGCNASKVITIHETKTPKEHLEAFWKLLGGNIDDISIVNAGHPDEDEIYETKITETNMVYELQDDELVPCDTYWGSLLKIDMLNPSKILVFDFGVEMYVWTGKNTSLDRRKTAIRLAKELWDEDYDYSECDLCPITSAAMLGSRESEEVSNKIGKRPEWALIAKVMQNMETVLFREKFIDWPDYTRVIQVKESELDKSFNSSIEVHPCDISEIIGTDPSEPDLILHGSHLGRGTQYYDSETNRHFEILTTEVTTWHIQEFDYDKLDEKSLGHFFTGDTYIIRWQYTVTVTGRELSGQPSRHSLVGRDRCAYFCWQGRDASLNEKGAAALLTVELDHERGPQVRIGEGSEPPAFLNLFEGKMVIHMGKREDFCEKRKYSSRLYVCRGDVENETVLVEVPCNAKQLRSKVSFILVNTNVATVTVWHGAKALTHTRKMALKAAKKIKMNKDDEFGFSSNASIILDEVNEGSETKDMVETLKLNESGLYMSLVNDPHAYNKTPRLFHLSSILGEFQATEILCPYRHSNIITPYPFVQSDLYSASQPALFLFDNINSLWLWQGWWPERDSSTDNDSDNCSDQTGSGAIRFQAERRAAMRTTLSYWESKSKNTSESDLKTFDNDENESSAPVYLVWAGLEPLEFKNLFLTWMDREDVAVLNMKEGRKPGEILHVDRELSQLTRHSYTVSELMQRPLPDGVDPTRLEDYLPLNSFIGLFEVSKEQFTQLPTWRRTEMKKDVGLF